MKFPLIRKYFLTGLLVLVPVFITISVLSAFIGFFSSTPIGIAFDHWANELLFPTGSHELQGFGLIATLGITLITGVIASTVGGHRVLAAVEHLLMKTPLVNVIYPSAKQMIDFVLAPKGQGFSKVVLVEFPRKGTHAIGFVTGDAPASLAAPLAKGGGRFVSVFVPFAPAPMSGALLVVREDEVIPVTMSVEEAFKFILSAGVLAPITAKIGQLHSGATRGS